MSLRLVANRISGWDAYLYSTTLFDRKDGHRNWNPLQKTPLPSPLKTTAPPPTHKPAVRRSASTYSSKMSRKSPEMERGQGPKQHATSINRPATRMVPADKDGASTRMNPPPGTTRRAGKSVGVETCNSPPPKYAMAPVREPPPSRPQMIDMPAQAEDMGSPSPEPEPTETAGNIQMEEQQPQRQQDDSPPKPMQAAEQCVSMNTNTDEGAAVLIPSGKKQEDTTDELGVHPKHQPKITTRYPTAESAEEIEPMATENPQTDHPPTSKRFDAQTTPNTPPGNYAPTKALEDITPKPVASFPRQMTHSERIHRLHRLGQYTPALLEPLRTTVMTTPYLVEIPSRWFYMSLSDIYGSEERTFTNYLRTEQPSLITAFLTADFNLLLRDRRTNGMHLRAFARGKYGLVGTDVAHYMRVPSLSLLLEGVKEYVDVHPVHQLNHTLNDPAHPGTVTVYSHFIIPEQRGILSPTDELTRHLAVCPPPSSTGRTSVDAHRTTTVSHVDF